MKPPKCRFCSKEEWDHLCREPGPARPKTAKSGPDKTAQDGPAGSGTAKAPGPVHGTRKRAKPATAQTGTAGKETGQAGESAPCGPESLPSGPKPAQKRTRKAYQRNYYRNKRSKTATKKPGPDHAEAQSDPGQGT